MDEIIRFGLILCYYNSKECTVCSNGSFSLLLLRLHDAQHKLMQLLVPVAKVVAEEGL